MVDGLTRRQVQPLVRAALREDRAGADVTSRLLFAKTEVLTARLVAREAGVVCGLAVAHAVFADVDRRIHWRAIARDGTMVRRSAVLARLRGPARAILSAERTAVNFLGRLSGIATLTRRYVQAARGTRAAILDTRKTTPGLRLLERYAVRCGGGTSHRMDLGAQILIKRNHLVGQRCTDDTARLERLLRDVRCRAPRGCQIEVEVADARQVPAVAAAHPDILMLDNLSPAAARRVARWLRHQRRRPTLEVSGGVTLRNVRAFALTGADRIAVGALTHSARWLDVALEVEPPTQRGKA